MAAAVPLAPAPTVSLMDGGRRIRNIVRKRSLSGDTPGGRCCLSFPMRTLGLRPCISMGRRSNSKFPNCPNKVFFKKSTDLIERRETQILIAVRCLLTNLLYRRET
jgi:hypothetical protein